MVVVAVMMQGDAVELEEGVRDFVARGRQSTIQRNSLQVLRSRAADIYTFTLLDVAEVEGVDATSLMRDNGGLHVPNESPLSRSEERVGLDIGGPCPGSKSPVLIFDQELPDQRLADAAKLLGIDI